MRKLLIILTSIALLLGCNKPKEAPPEPSDGIYAITEIGIANHWCMSMLNKELWDFELFGDTIKFGGFAYGASTTENKKLIVYTGQSLKHTDLSKGRLIKEVSVNKVIFGLESSGNDDFIYAMTGSNYNNSYFSKINIETGEITTLSNIQIESELSRCPSTLITDNASYFVYGRDNSRKIYCFSTVNGTLKNEIPISGTFPLHRIDGLEYNEQDGLIYYMENREDGRWRLMTLNPDNSQINLFLDNIDLLYNINTILLDNKNQKYFIQNHSTLENIVITIIDLSTKQIETHINSNRVIELNQIR